MPHPARIFITGSSDGLGLLAAQRLIAEGHRVVLHARNQARAKDARRKAPGAEDVLIADLADKDQVIELADQVNTRAVETPFDAVIHNAAVYEAPHDLIFTVNTLAPYILTSRIQKPKRLIYIGSSMFTGGRARLENLQHRTTYGESKFHILLLMKAVARTWPELSVNTVNPGWVPTKMGGPGAPDDLEKGYDTQSWLAVSDDAAAKVTGQYFYHRKTVPCKPPIEDHSLQDLYIARMEAISGIIFP